ncbi:MAG: hypothetical protein GX963_06945 [Bacteroidales bacterium]|nr:hypothetical protein [Bacteroidales bacterium]
MKLLVVLSIREYEQQVEKLLDRAGLKRFSVTSITGYRKKEKDLSWFGSCTGCAKTNSIMIFSFAPKTIADQAIEEINKYNEQERDPFPLHAFVLDVENFSKIN